LTLCARSNARFWLVEAKASKTVQPSMAAPMLSLWPAPTGTARRRIRGVSQSRTGTAFTALAKGAEALTLEQFVRKINNGKTFVRQRVCRLPMDANGLY